MSNQITTRNASNGASKQSRAVIYQSFQKAFSGAGATNKTVMLGGGDSPKRKKDTFGKVTLTNKTFFKPNTT